MTDVVHLHVGEPKTGTTYLQAMLMQHQEQLAVDGLLVPGRRIDQVRGAQEMLDPREEGRGRFEGRWQSLADEIASYAGPAAVVSMESLVRARPEQAERAVTALGVSSVRVIITVRDLARVIPAQWQESLQFGHTWTFDEYVQAVTAPRPRSSKPGRSFWDQHDTENILQIWGDVVGQSNVILVTLPRTSGDPLALWRRFAAALGIDGDPYGPAPTANESLGAASAELMRRVNLEIGPDTLTRQEYSRLLRDWLSKTILAARRESESRVVLPESAQPWAHAKSEETISTIAKAGVTVIGDLDDLRVASPPASSPAAASEPPSDTDVSAAAVAAMASMVLSRRRQT